ncbi:2,3-dihydro-2,3-dihydroxybenzoate dehydrogenase, partial [Salmonella enterica subsp. enterica serovar Hadar]|nr:2,3-dihydro-2,3-dihydroxybenzoate dehydrogenase [Salmonella enterica subsp. enterica serovar Hadar]
MGAAFSRGRVMPCIDFSDKTVWVTGAGKGIGYAT